MSIPIPKTNLVSPGVEPTLADELVWLEQAKVTELKVRWAEVFGRPAPLSLHSGMIRRSLAYRLQTEVHGDLPARLKQELRLLARSTEEGARRRPRIAMPLGSRLVRVWRGDLYEVTMVAGGFEWNGTTYGSLTRVAREITGTHWNGLRFFGVREAARG